MFDNSPARYFINSYKNMMAVSRKYLCPSGTDIKEVDATVSWHEMARNQLVELADGEWLLMLDTDHAFMPDLLGRLLRIMNAYNLPVVSGMYQYKQPNMGGRPVANIPGDNGGFLPLTTWDKQQEIVQVANVGGGCLLTKTSVFRKIQKELGQKPFDNIAGLSEDYSFCYRCNKLGIPIFVCPKIEAHHATTNFLSIDDYVASNPQLFNLEKG